MIYSWLELIFYFFVYSFLGWLLEVGFFAIKDGKFYNRGLLNMPLILSYGISMDLLIILMPATENNYIFKFVVVLVVMSVTSFITAAASKHMSKVALWPYESYNLFSGNKRSWLFGILVAGIYLVVLEIFQPVLFMIGQMMPWLMMLIICAILGLMVILDYITIFYAIHKRNKGYAIPYQKERYNEKRQFGERVIELIWRRIRKAYPNMQPMETGPFGKQDKKTVFAQRFGFDQIVWIFIICAFVGDIIETIFCRVTAGVWMSRSSVIYGPFSVVWGFGAVVLTMVLRKLKDKEDRYVFFSGCLIGGVYEYMCSVFTEIFFGTTFWDYSHMPFNIGGRTNLLYCVFWGLLSVVWIKLCYPQISRLISKIPPLTGKICTWVIVVFMICNGLISAMAMVRYTERKAGYAADNSMEVFLDENYKDNLIEWVWPNMKIE